MSTLVEDFETDAEVDADFERYYLKMHDRLVTMAAGFFHRDTATGEDVVQDAFIRAHKSWNSCHTSREHWLTTIVRNTALNRIKSDKNNPVKYSIGEDSEEPAGLDRTIGDVMPDESVEIDQLCKMIEANYDRLDVNFKEVWDLREEGYTYAEIAETLGIPINTVRTRLRRTGHKLRSGW